MAIRIADWGLGEFRPLQILLAYSTCLMAEILWLLHRDSRSVALLAQVHRSALSRRASSRVLKRLGGNSSSSVSTFQIERVRNAWVRLAKASIDMTSPHVTSDALLGGRVLVVKAASSDERGVIIADYSYVFPILANNYDIRAIAARYHIVLEPSWSGFCTPELMCIDAMGVHAFVQASEPRDADLLRQLSHNLTPVPISSNWWIDHRVFYPSREPTKDIDIIMVAAWASFKRHWAVFSALRKLKSQGRILRLALVGYPSDLTINDLLSYARAMGVQDQVDVYENIPPERVAAMFRRSRVHLLWSRKEGVNKAVIEAMLAGVPTVVRNGFNYGYEYPFINSQTGSFSTEKELPRTLIRLLQDCEGMSPRDWVMDHMTCQHATEILEEAIRAYAITRGEAWTHGLVVKTKSLDRQMYWDPSVYDEFRSDYNFLAQARRC
jgi:glycosyltransferase involved in cell wall biosynthesis